MRAQDSSIRERLLYILIAGVLHALAHSPFRPRIVLRLHRAQPPDHILGPVKASARDPLGVRRSSPAAACSPVDSRLSVPASAALPTRSGWARISVSCCSPVASYIVAQSLSCNSVTLSKGPSSQACNAIQGEPSNKNLK